MDQRQSELWIVVQPARGDPRELAVTAARATRIGEITSAVAQHLGLAAEPQLGLFSGRRQAWLAPSESLEASGLVSGDTLVLGTTGDTSDWSASASRHLKLDLVALEVTGGPAGGTRIGLPYGEHVVGRGETASVSIDDPSLSREHFSVRVAETGVFVTDRGSHNGTAVEGVRLEPNTEIRIDGAQMIEAGRTVLTFARDGKGQMTDALPVKGGRVLFNRPPRVERSFQADSIALDEIPSKPAKGRLPLAASLIPVAMGVIAYFILHNIGTLLFAGLGPAMAIWTFVDDRHSGRKAYTGKRRSFHEKADIAAERLRVGFEAERDERRRAAPGPAELLKRATSYSPNLWERRVGDDDFMQLRVGTGAQSAATRVAIAEMGEEALRDQAAKMFEPYREISAVPITVSLPAVGGLGVCGIPERTDPLVWWLVFQAAALHSPRDLVIAGAFSAGPAAEWMKWLPHTHSDSSPLAGDHLTTTRDGARALVEDVVRVESDRRASREEDNVPQILLILDESVTPDRATVAALIDKGRDTGVSVIWVGERARDVPGECQAIAELQPDVAALALTLAREGSTVRDITADGVTRAVALEGARALAPMRDTSTGRRGQIPRRVTLLSLADLEPTADSLAERWRASGDSLRVLIGESADGPVELDLHDTPHGLVAGMTGAGKSELLQSFVASLALNYPPTKVTFLLVDYKGGSAFKDCTNLPHTVGFVTDLDEHLTQRALTSLYAELQRREQILNDADARDLVELVRRKPEVAPPSLVIVIDEFATLVNEVPEFVAGVVDVAQRGRSLGVHLILATQRPGGVVSENIRANTPLRIALRVNSSGDSIDVIERDSAARIPGGREWAGRGFVRVGHGTLTEFQAAYVGGISATRTDEAEVSVRDLAVSDRTASQEYVLPTDEGTDLARIADAARAAHRKLELAQPLQPWLNPLPGVIPLVPPQTSSDGVAVIGVVDEPERQRQREYALDLPECGSVLVYGTSGAGKTTLMRTTVAALAQSTPPERLHVYGLDFGSRGLAALEALPHCGAVIPGEDQERVHRLFARLRREVARRKDAFAAAGVDSYEQHERRTNTTLPRIVVLLDNYGGFTAAYDSVNAGELVELLPRLVADGRPLGIHFVISADRRGAVRPAVFGVISEKIVLRMASEDEYGSLGLDVKAVRGAVLPSGRGFVNGTLEFQAAVVGGRPDDQGAALENVAQLWPDRSGGAPAIQVLPTAVALSDLPRSPEALTAVVGLAATDFTGAIADLRDGNFLVTGPYRSGRSTALTAIAATVVGADVWVLAPRRSPILDAGQWARVAGGVEACEETASELALSVSRGDDFARPVLLVVDDAEQLTSLAVAGHLETIVRRGRDVGVRVCAAVEIQAAARAYSGWLSELRKDERGVLLDPQPDQDGAVLGVRLPRRAVGGIPGRGYLVSNGELELIQVALTGEGAPSLG